ncbi:MerR family transcriptional regulator [Streptomyces scopuliridis]|uniref:MerR family transcriptional regulator n=1 Tax=Streptomyces scopuliridis TaxID=452529 RepID=UPI003675EB96
MPWSTRQLADLADTTVNTIRHYHHLGLLDEPERRHNGYKQYEVRHLVSLLRIRRLAELGVPLSQIGDVSADTDSTPGVLRNLDAELQRRIERLKKARTDIAAILRARASADVPAGFESVASRLSEADSSMIHIYGQLYDQNALADVQKMVEANTDDVSADIDRLPADADEETPETSGRKARADSHAESHRLSLDKRSCFAPVQERIRHRADVRGCYVGAVQPCPIGRDCPSRHSCARPSVRHAKAEWKGGRGTCSTQGLIMIREHGL